MQLFITHWKSLLSIALSIAVIAVFLEDANKQEVWTLLSNVEMTWLLVALFIKSISLSIHEYRLWLGFGTPRPPIQQTMQIGFASALLNILFPGRAGDIAAIAMLNRKCDIPVGTATFAVGMVGFFEGAIFGVMMLAVLLFNAPMWIQFLGEDIHTQSLQTISGLTLLGIGVVLIAAIIGRRFTEAEPDSDQDFSPVFWIKSALNQTGQNLTDIHYIILNSVASIAEVGLMIAAFAMGFTMLNLQSEVIALTPLLTWSLSGLILGISAIASIVFPPTYGAGSTAAAIFILGLFGFDQAQAISFAGIWWLISQVPAVLLGVPALWLVNRKSTIQSSVE